MRAEGPLGAIAGRAAQVLEWDRSHRFCGVCGAPTVLRDDERSRACTVCDFRAYPRHSPAVIVLITRGENEVLLGRSARFPAGMYSTLAGFVDPGESAEDAASLRGELEAVLLEFGLGFERAAAATAIAE
mgnify:CR=1 FL=1